MDWQAEDDQRKAASRSLAAIAMTLKKEFIDAGFTNDEAQQLLNIWLRETLWEQSDARHM